MANGFSSFIKGMKKGFNKAVIKPTEKEVIKPSEKLINDFSNGTLHSSNEIEKGIKKEPAKSPLSSDPGHTQTDGAPPNTEIHIVGQLDYQISPQLASTIAFHSSIL